MVVVGDFAAKRGDANLSRWKVTATFTLRTGPDTEVRCIRVRAPNCGQTLHFSVAEFDRLFIKLQDR